MIYLGPVPIIFKGPYQRFAYLLKFEFEMNEKKKRRKKNQMF